MGTSHRAFSLLLLLFIPQTLTQSTSSSTGLCQLGKCTECADGLWSSGTAACATCLSTTISDCDSTTGLATACFPGNGYSSNSSTCTSCGPTTNGLASTWSNGTVPCASCVSAAIASCSVTTGAVTGCNAGYGYVMGSCLPCAGGTASPQNTNRNCSICPAGQYSSPKSPLGCIPCAVNFYSGTAKSIVCSACTQGYTTSGLTSATSCFVCSPGNYEDITGMCSSCMGTGNAIQTCGPKWNIPNTCMGGYGMVNETCIGCLGGTSSPLGATAPCSSCQIGQFALPLASSCTGCLADTYSTNTTTTTCTNCAPGYFAPPSSSSCTKCSNGTYHSGLNTCSTCMSNPGTESCGPVLSTSNTCNVGFGLILGVCTVCLPGYYSPQGSSVPCAACLSNQFSSGQAGSCSTCLTSIGINSCGKSSPAANTCNGGYGLTSGACNACTAGSFASQNTTLSCSNCAAGTYSSLPLALSCTQCALDYYSTGSATVCTPCDVGKVALTLGSPSCNFCPVTTYKSDVATCSNCMDLGDSACDPVTSDSTACIPGYGLFNGSCNACLGGWASPGQTADCFSCGMGQYATPLSSSCTSCPADTFAATSYNTGCTNCTPGWISSLGSAGCKKCPTGSYHSGINACSTCMSNPGSESCGPVLSTSNTCNAGYGLNLGVCSVCLPGYFSIQGNSSPCTPCIPGSSAKDPQSSSCTPCGLDTYASANASTSCTACDQGFISGIGSPVCSICRPTTWESGIDICTTCMQPNFASCGPATPKANTCNAGYGLVNGGCNICSVNYYSLQGSNIPCSICTDVNGASCNSFTGATLTCNKNYSLISGVCQHN